MLYPEHERPARKEYFEEMALELRYKSEWMKRGRSDSSFWWTGLDDDDGSSWGTLNEPDSNIEDFGSSDDDESAASSPGGDKKPQGAATDGEKQDENPANTTITSDMTYQCDAHLGAPSATDCEKLAWSGLKPATTIETLRPNIPNI